MSSKKYKLKAVEGISYEQMTDSLDNLYRYGRIVRNVYGVEVSEPFTQIGAEVLNVKLDEEATVTDYIIYGKEIIEYPKQQEFGELFDGINPHYQLIHQLLRDHDRISEKALIRLYTEKYRFLPNNRSGINYLKEILERMRLNGYLLLEIEREGLSRIIWYKIGRGIRTRNKRRLEAKEGYDPVMLAIYDFLDNFVEGATFNDIFRYMVNGIAWLETINDLERYLNLMVTLGNIVEVNGMYRVKEPIKPFQH